MLITCDHTISDPSSKATVTVESCVNVEFIMNSGAESLFSACRVYFGLEPIFKMRKSAPTTLSFKRQSKAVIIKVNPQVQVPSD